MSAIEHFPTSSFIVFAIEVYRSQVLWGFIATCSKKVTNLYDLIMLFSVKHTLSSPVEYVNAQSIKNNLKQGWQY